MIPHISNLDLNLLRVFDALLQEESVSRAGVRLGLSQSAVSHALGRLREALGDELFRRGPAGMQPTARALEIGPAVHAALAQIQAALAPQTFDPAAAERPFTLIGGPYVSAVLAAGPDRAPARTGASGRPARHELRLGRDRDPGDRTRGRRPGRLRRARPTRSTIGRCSPRPWSGCCARATPLARPGAAFTVETLAELEHVAIDYPRPEVTPEDRRPRRRTTLGDRGALRP